MGREVFDQEDEFQFKPLTKGLGFHRKEVQKTTFETQDETQTLNLKKTQFKARGLDLLEDDKEFDFRSPLPQRNPSKSADFESLSPASTAVDEILKNVRPQNKLKSSPTTEKIKPQIQQSTFEQVPVSLGAGILDGMLIVAGTLLGFIVLLSVTKVDLFANLANPQSSEIFFASGAVFVGVSIIYYLITRVFLGCSAGEWAYDQQMGLPKDQQSWTFSLMIVLRSVLALATGIVVLPLLSAIFRRDLLGQWIGLELYRRH